MISPTFRGGENVAPVHRRPPCLQLCITYINKALSNLERIFQYLNQLFSNIGFKVNALWGKAIEISGKTLGFELNYSILNL